MSEARNASVEVRRSDSGPTRSSTSAGLPDDNMAAADRIAELDARLARLEGSTGYRERGRNLLGRVMPPDASRHFRNAGREELLGIRSIVDFWIRRIDAADEHAESRKPEPESIEIE